MLSQSTAKKKAKRKQKLIQTQPWVMKYVVPLKNQIKLKQ